MSINIHDRGQIATLDKSSILASIEQLPDQIKDAWEQTSTQSNESYATGVNHVVVSGMGGSTLGAHVIQSIAKQYLKVPLEIVKDYTLPGYINEHTLVILSSYSGTTEETLAAAKVAEAKHAKIAVITSGGDLQELAIQKNYPHYFINPTHNPSNQPRMAIGYAIVGQVGLLKSFGLIDCQSLNIDTITSFLKQKSQDYAPENQSNQAILLAKQVADKIIFLVSAEHLTGPTHVFNNQLNENAKHLTVELQLPELNHHYMEGLSHPDDAKQHGHFFFINSKLYSSKLQLRIKLTKDVVTKNGYPSTIIEMTHTDPIVQAFELIQLGAYINFYLAMLHDINPAPIPWVDYFKAQLKANS